jgi:predicted MPP superfamily phosphohydrolase
MLNEQSKPFKINIYSLGENRQSPQQDVLENRWLHQLFLLTHKPATWPAWQLALGLLIIAGLVWLIWLPLGATALTAAAIYFVFALGDWLLLWCLPHTGRSFGPIGPQLFVMTGPCVGVVILGMLLGLINPAIGLWAFIILQLAGTLFYLWGMVKEPFALSMTRRTIKSPYLPSNTPPIRLLHLSDFHVERLTRREAHVLKLIEEANADLIVITGDYLNLSYVNEPIARDEVRKVLAKIDAPYGVYATLGSPPVDPRDTTPSLFDGLDNIRLLRDEVAVLDLDQGRTLALLGMDCEHDLDMDAEAFKKLVELAPPDSMRVLLYHSPELMPQVQQYPVDLYLCGHTHGGQVRVPGYGAILTSSALGKQYEMGPYVENETTLYISRGIGLEGLSAPRIRLLCPPEIILFTLEGTDGH